MTNSVNWQWGGGEGDSNLPDLKMTRRFVQSPTNQLFFLFVCLFVQLIWETQHLVSVDLSQVTVPESNAIQTRSID